MTTTRENHRESPSETPLQRSKGHRLGYLSTHSTLSADIQTRINENKMRTKTQ